MLRTIVEGEPEFDRKLKALADRSGTLPESIEKAARAIIAEVRRHGDAAVRECTQRFEARELGALELTAADWDAAVARVPANVRQALAEAAARIRA
jgi:histidinol dehydrogenase